PAPRSLANPGWQSPSLTLFASITPCNFLLYSFCGAFFGGARTGQNIGQRVISFMTRIFINRPHAFIQGNARGPGPGEGRGIVNREFVLNHIRGYWREAFREM